MNANFRTDLVPRCLPSVFLGNAVLKIFGNSQLIRMELVCVGCVANDLLKLNQRLSLDVIFKCITVFSYLVRQVLAISNDKNMVYENFVISCHFFIISSASRFIYVFDYQFQLQKINEWTQSMNIPHF